VNWICGLAYDSVEGQLEKTSFFAALKLLALQQSGHEIAPGLLALRVPLPTVDATRIMAWDKLVGWSNSYRRTIAHVLPSFRPKYPLFAMF
jgi:hypothetical protein